MLDRAGGIGVTIFFVLSGFLITSLLLEERARTGRNWLPGFWLRRARRLLPAVAVFLIAMAVVGIALAELIPVAAYYANWSYAIGGPFDPLVHTWTLSVEEQFYAIWPLVFIGLALVPRSAVIGLIALGIAASTLMRLASVAEGDPYHWTYFATHLRADALLSGCLLAFIFSRRIWIPSRLTIAIGVAAIVGASLLEQRDVHAVVGIPVAIVGSVVLVSAAATRTVPVLAWRQLIYVGTISYGLYLWHRPLTWWVRDNDLGAIPMVAAVALSVAIAMVSRRWIEEPFLRKRTLRTGLMQPDPNQTVSPLAGPIGTDTPPASPRAATSSAVPRS
jgi:peptidoglycan/LPS O-acetylase OafA/YrhL